MSQTQDETICGAVSPRMGDVCVEPKGHRLPHRDAEHENSWGWVWEPGFDAGVPSPSAPCRATSGDPSRLCVKTAGHHLNPYDRQHRSAEGYEWMIDKRDVVDFGLPHAVDSVPRAGAEAKSREGEDPATCGQPSDATGERGAPCTRPVGHIGMHWVRAADLAATDEHEDDETDLCGATNEISPFSCIRERDHGGLHQGANDQTWAVDFREQPDPLPAPVLYCPSTREYDDARYHCLLDPGHEGDHRGLGDRRWQGSPAPAPPLSRPLSALASPAQLPERCASVRAVDGRRCFLLMRHANPHASPYGTWTDREARTVPADPPQAVDHAGCSRLLEEQETSKRLRWVLRNAYDDLQTCCDSPEETMVTRRHLLGAIKFALDATGTQPEPEDDLEAEIAKHAEGDRGEGDAPTCWECGKPFPCPLVRLEKERQELKDALDEIHR